VIIRMKRILISLCFILFGAQEISSQVSEEWVARYNGPENSGDWARALKLDDSGNVYVTGRSWGIGTNADFATIKYNSSGDTIWVRRYNGPGNSYDEANAIALDDSGNVYLTGISWGIGTGSDYATIKSNSSGDTLWVRRYNGPGNSYDEASAIALDNSGNVYVTGTSRGSVFNFDYTTIKYNRNGDTVWVRRYNGLSNSGGYAKDLSVDDSGFVYVTGHSSNGTSLDYATIKYSSNGDTLWVRRYNGPGNSDDYANAIVIDGSGYIYVTGRSAASDSIPFFNYDYATIKYNSNGDTLWVRRYNGPGNSDDNANAIAMDGSGNIYVTGGSWGVGTKSDYTTIKYDSAGETLWVRRYNEPGNLGSRALALALDSSENVYVTGYSRGVGTWWDYATIKYDSVGETLWVMRYNGPGNDTDEAYAIAVDGSGNVYVTGRSWGSGTVSDYATIKYSETIGVEEENSQFAVHNSKLLQSQPNPFRHSTTIRYTLISRKQTAYSKQVNIPVRLVVYDITGRLVETLVDQVQQLGVYHVVWEAKNQASGIYFYQLQSGDFQDSRKVILLR
jgi:hypothetical protein